MKNLQNYFVAFFIGLIGIFALSSFGSVPSPSAAEEHRVESREASANKKKADKKEVRKEQRITKLEDRMSKAKTPKQKDRMQRKINKVKASETVGKLALIFGAIGLGLVVISIIFVFLPLRFAAAGAIFWGLFMLSFLFSLAGLIMGAISKNEHSKGKIGFILGLVGVILWFVFLIVLLLLTLLLLGAFI